MSLDSGSNSDVIGTQEVAVMSLDSGSPVMSLDSGSSSDVIGLGK